jgi:hypothetical protein
MESNEDEDKGKDNVDSKSVPDKLIQYKSWVWHYGKLSFISEKGKKAARWNCDECARRHQSYSLTAKSTTWIGRHLRDEHQMLKMPYLSPVCPTMLNGERSKSVIDMLNLTNKEQTYDLAKFRRDMTMWISTSRQAFLVVEEPKFREMIADLSPDAAAILPKCSDTIRNWVVSEFEKQKEFMIQRLAQSRSRIHLSMDIWTTPSGNRSYLAIVANWVDIDFEIRNVLIALPPLEGQHTGANIAAAAFKVIEEYNIGIRVGYYMLDSASNNDTGVEELYSLLVSRYGEEAVLIPSIEGRLRCFGHILNLSAKDMLFGSDSEAFESQSINILDAKTEEAEFLKWRKIGPVGKAHNFVLFIHRSSQRRDAFREVQTVVLKWSHSIMPSMNNATRWNSFFLMINDMLNLREAVDLYINMCRTSKTMEKKDKQRLEMYCTLTEEDWEQLTHLHALLYDFWELTIRMQGNVAKKLRADVNLNKTQEKVYGKSGEQLFGKPKSTPITSSLVETSEDGALFNVLPAYDHILSKLEDAKKRYMNDPHLATCINLAWKKMEKYYSDSDLSKVYLVAAVLDPRVKLRYFEQNWKQKWLTGAREKLAEYSEQFILAMQINQETINTSFNSDVNNPEIQESNTTFGSWRQSDEDDGETGIQREWDEYLEAARVKDYKGFSVRRWWIAQQGRFPILFQVALELLAIPAMSTEVERVFSGYTYPNLLINNRTKLTLTALRSRLSPDAVEAIEVCVALYKKGLFVDEVWDEN